MHRVLQPLKSFAAGLLFAAGVLLVAAFGPLVLQAVESSYFPVLSDWSPVDVRRDGQDLIVTGTMVKRRAECQYIPPQRVRDDTIGQHLQLVSMAPTSGVNWDDNDGRPQFFGPWRVVGGAGRVLEFYSEHRCPGQPSPTFSRLGRIDDTQAR